MKIGFVGLGVVGTEMVKHLRAKNYDVIAYPRGAGL
jgi:3-hydroxyisobutyrate dehydrogenase-like beta-hydroxyacid dehydrogenase